MKNDPMPNASPGSIPARNPETSPQLRRVVVRSKHKYGTEKVYNHAERAALCKQHGVKNTGRQWTKLRKRLGLAIRQPLGTRYKTKKST